MVTNVLYFYFFFFFGCCCSLKFISHFVCVRITIRVPGAHFIGKPGKGSLSKKKKKKKVFQCGKKEVAS